MLLRHLACLLLILGLSATAVAGEGPEENNPADVWSPYTLFRKPPRPATMVVPGFLWVEAEDFADYGDWRLDTQFVQQMGSAYLIAAGVGRPIADAATEVQLAQAGRYRLWVRARTGSESMHRGSSAFRSTASARRRSWGPRTTRLGSGSPPASSIWRQGRSSWRCTT